MNKQQELGYKLGLKIYKYRKIIKTVIVSIILMIWHSFLLSIVQEMINETIREECRAYEKNEYRRSTFEKVNQRQYPRRKKCRHDSEFYDSRA